MGRPICSVISFANSSWRSFSSFSAFLTISCLSERAVRRYEAKACVALSGMAWRSASERPFRVRIGLLVMGEMVVIFSTDMMVGLRRDLVDKLIGRCKMRAGTNVLFCIDAVNFGVEACRVRFAITPMPVTSVTAAMKIELFPNRPSVHCAWRFVVSWFDATSKYFLPRPRYQLTSPSIYRKRDHQSTFALGSSCL